MRNSEIANQLNSQNLDTVLPSSIKTVGGRVFPDARSSDGLADLRDIVDSYRASHAVAYGNIVPSSGIEYSIQPANNVNTDLIAPGLSEVVHLQALSFHNESGATPAEITITMGNTLLSNQIVVGPNSHLGWNDILGYNLPDLIIASGQSLKLTITAGETEKTTIYASANKSCL